MSKTACDVFLTDVAAAIRARRQAARMTLEDLAYESDITSRHLHEIEKGRTNPTLRSLFNIATGLGVKVIDIINDAERRAKTIRKS